MPLAPLKPYKDMTVDDIRELVKNTREVGLQIQSNYKRLEQEYSDWEDRVNELNKIIQQAEDDAGITKEEIYSKPDIIDDILDMQDSSEEGDILDGVV